jgi:membrane-bound serine protease (ClpP class)
MFDFGWMTLGLLGLGLLVVVLEVMFPSGGLLGIGAAVCLGLAGYFAFQEGGPPALVGYGLLVLIGAPTAVVGTFKVLPYTPMGKKIILSGPSFTDREATEEGLESLVGQRGRTLTALRPAGIVSISQRRVDVVTRGGHLGAGEEILVTKVEGNRVVVERVTG